MNPHMLEHLQSLALEALLNPLLLSLCLGVYFTGRLLGGFMPWATIVKPMVMIYVVGLVLKLFVFTAGYDLYFMFGMPFIAGLWGGSKKWAS